MVNNIRNNTISEIDAKKDLNALNEIRDVEEIKYKKRTPGQKKLINLFDDLSDLISTHKTLESKSQENENEKVKSRKEENEDEDYENKYENKDEDEDYENENEYENEYDDETIDQNKIKNLNDNLDKRTDKSKSFEDQIESLKELEDLEEYWFMKDFDDKELKFKIFKLRLAHLLVKYY